MIGGLSLLCGRTECWYCFRNYQSTELDWPLGLWDVAGCVAGLIMACVRIVKAGLLLRDKT